MSADDYEFCPRCEANLTLQKGFSRELPNWICKGCGEMLINPDMEGDSDIVWICDGCGATLNVQKGFSEQCGQWKCEICGFDNTIDDSEIYLSEDEYQAELENPYRGISDEAALELSSYEEISQIENHNNISIVKDIENGNIYIRKILDIYNADIYKYFYDNPVNGMPEIMAVYESERYLIVIEEYIEGRTLSDILDNGPVRKEAAVAIVQRVWEIVCSLHRLNPPVIHRDIKPENVIISPQGKVYLLDINAAKWYDSDSKEDTVLLGTKYYAAPEQYGFGDTSSSEKTDVYALGVLLNKLVTGSFPKEKMAEGAIGEIVRDCIWLDAEKRLTDRELMERLEKL